MTLSASHALDLAVFGNGVPYGRLTQASSLDEVGRKMRKAWVNFASTGRSLDTGFRMARLHERGTPDGIADRRVHVATQSLPPPTRGAG